MRIIVTGGGTGGHLFPGIALATGLQQKIPGCRILFLGTSRILDQQALAGHGFELGTITCMGLKGMGFRRSVQSVLQLLPALLEARRIIKRFMPDLIFGVGGYVTGPVLLAGRFCGIPLCIHEQNSVPGLTNKLLARIVDRIFLSIPCEYPFPGKKIRLTGNPLRQEILEAEDRREGSEKKMTTLLILGGSQGAHRVNLLVAEAVEKLAGEYGEHIRIVHQTGTADEEAVRDRYQRIGIRAEVQAFFQDMAGLYSKANLVVSRAGATTLAELAVTGVPALLIPYPHAADNHQKTNALYYQQGGAAKMLPESGLDGEILAGEIRTMLDDRELLRRMSGNMKSLGKPEATERIIEECLDLIGMKLEA